MIGPEPKRITASEAEASMAEFRRIVDQRFSVVVEKIQTPLLDAMKVAMEKRNGYIEQLVILGIGRGDTIDPARCKVMRSIVVLLAVLVAVGETVWALPEPDPRVTFDCPKVEYTIRIRRGVEVRDTITQNICEDVHP